MTRVSHAKKSWMQSDRLESRIGLCKFSEHSPGSRYYFRGKHIMGSARPNRVRRQIWGGRAESVWINPTLQSGGQRRAQDLAGRRFPMSTECSIHEMILPTRIHRTRRSLASAHKSGADKDGGRVGIRAQATPGGPDSAPRRGGQPRVIGPHGATIARRAFRLSRRQDTSSRRSPPFGRERTTIVYRVSGCEEEESFVEKLTGCSKRTAIGCH